MVSFQIAIDGPVAAGKGTVSRLVADRLGLIYIDTGAMYRAVAYQALKEKVDWDNVEGLVKIIKNHRIELQTPKGKKRDSRLTTVLIDGKDMSWDIRTELVGKGASQIANHKHVRRELVALQQKIALSQDVIMEGRDITSVVLPKAKMKVYLTANDVVRAKRRHLELLVRGEDVSFENVYQQLLIRDKENIERKESPLKIVPDAWVIDTSDLAIPQVVSIICSRAEIIRREKTSQKK